MLHEKEHEINIHECFNQHGIRREISARKKHKQRQDEHERSQRSHNDTPSKIADYSEEVSVTGERGQPKRQEKTT